MIVLVTGSREDSYTLEDLVYKELNEIHKVSGISLIVSGACTHRNTFALRGADRYAIEWALLNEIDFRGFPARWNKDGYPQAGPMRNRRILEQVPEVDLVLAFPGGRGTENMVKTATEMGYKVKRV